MARKLTGTAFVSLDGVMQAPGGTTEDPTGGFPHGGWLFGHSDEAIDETIGPLFDRPFALLLGRRTYDIFAAYWPFAPADDPIAVSFARCEKFVLTHSDTPLTWQGSQRLANIDHVARIKAQDGPELVIQGSSTLYPQLLTAGLIDELVVLTAPVLLGRGKRLFGDGTAPGGWRMTAFRTGSKGCVAAHYVPDGPVQTGTFGEQGPNPLEQDRQRRMEEGTW